MNQDNQEKLSIWKTWLIKKLLNNDSSKEEILNLIANQDNEGELNNPNDNNEKSLIKNILQLENKSVEDVMVPRGEIISIDNKLNYNQIFDIIKEESHSRLPVYENNLDNIVGFFHVKDFIKINKNEFDLNLILRDVLYTAPKSPILELLKRMRLSRIHIALVVDGVGGVDGLVTIEDLVEEIVGEIQDEHDNEEVIDFKKIDDKTFVADAKMEVSDFIKRTNMDFNSDKVDTLGGYVFSLINRVPHKGEIIKTEDKKYAFEIVDADPRKIKVLKIYYS